MTKYHYNPVALNETTREFFPHIQSLYLYSHKDNTFENDDRIMARKKCDYSRRVFWARTIGRERLGA